MTDHISEFADATTPQQPEWRIPEFSAVELAQASVAELLALLIEHEDRVPHALIDACVARGDSIVPQLNRHLARLEELLDPDCPSGEWWLLLHAVHILGRIPGVQAGEALVRFMRDLDRSDDDVLCDWVAGMWPHFLGGKPASVIAQVRDMVDDATLEWGCRVDAATILVAAAMTRGAEALETVLDEIAMLASDERHSADFRVLLGCHLIGFPRERHRELMLRLSELELEGIGLFFSKGEVLTALEQQFDRPEWLTLPSPYSFYDEDRIIARQIRWTEEAQGSDGDDDLDEDLLAQDLDDWEPPGIPFVRETPKVGRNDACPCGSGKKFKKCCLK